MDSTPEARLARARLSLEGLSVGDGFGGFYEMGSVELIARNVRSRILMSAPWHWTDDTNMALSIFSILRKYDEIDQDALAEDFARHFDRGRGYGMGARALMNRMLEGVSWREVAPQMFKGGSFGNGGAMRVAPLGAYFADDFEAVVKNARLSAEITHAHSEGVAGAIAVAIAAAYACYLKGEPTPTRLAFINAVLGYVPDGEVREGIVQARDLPDGMPAHDVVNTLGNGRRVSAQDTVPFTLWCAGEQLASYENAIWLTASGAGDVDTTCAIVGGIVACYTGLEDTGNMQGIPAEWIKRREPLPEWAFVD